MKRDRYTSLDDIRFEKAEEMRQVKLGVKRLKNDVTEHFVPTNNIFLNSSNKYMNFIGYAITAYMTTVKGMFRFFSKWL